MVTPVKDIDPFAKFAEKDRDPFARFVEDERDPFAKFSPQSQLELDTANGNPQQNELLSLFGSRNVEVPKGAWAKYLEVFKMGLDTGTDEVEKNLIGAQMVFEARLSEPASEEREARLKFLDRRIAGKDPEGLEGTIIPLGDEDEPEPESPGFLTVEFWADAVGKQIPVLWNMGREGIESAAAAGSLHALTIPMTGGLSAPFLPLTMSVAGGTGALNNAFKQMTGNAYLEYRNFTDDEGNKLPEALARVGAVMSGAVGTGLEALPFGLLARMMPGVGKLLKKAGFKATEALKFPTTTQAMKSFLFKLAAMMLAEGGTEALQEATQVIAGETMKAFAEASGAGEFESVSVQETLARMTEAGIVGAGIGGGITVPVAGAGFGADIIQGQIDELKKNLQLRAAVDADINQLRIERRTPQDKGQSTDKIDKQLADLETDREKINKRLSDIVQTEADKAIEDAIKRTAEGVEPQELTPEVAEQVVKDVEEVVNEITGEEGDATKQGKSVFHGTVADFNAFETGKSAGGKGPATGGLDSIGIWFTSDKSEADTFSQGFDEEGNKFTGRTIETKIQLDNPVVFQSPDEFLEFIKQFEKANPQNLFDIDGNALKSNLQAAGNDGIVIKQGGKLDSFETEGDWFVVFEPSQVEQVEVTADEIIEKVEEKLAPVGPSQPVRKEIIRGRLTELNDLIKDIDVEVLDIDEQIVEKEKGRLVVGGKKPKKQSTKRLEFRKKKLLKQREDLDSQRDTVIKISLINEIGATKPISKERIKFLSDEQRFAVITEEANLILEELEQGQQGERIIPEKQQELSVEQDQDAFGVKSTNPPYLFDDLDIVGKKQKGKGKKNRRKKSTVIAAVENIINNPNEEIEVGNDVAQAIRNRLFQLINDRIEGDAKRFQPGVGLEDPFRSNNVLEEELENLEAGKTTIKSGLGTQGRRPEVDTSGTTESKIETQRLKDQIATALNIDELTQADIPSGDVVKVKAKVLEDMDKKSLEAQERALNKGLREGARLAKNNIKQAMRNITDLVNSIRLPESIKTKENLQQLKDAKTSIINQFLKKSDRFIENISELKSKVATTFERLALKEQKERVRKSLSSKAIKPNKVGGVKQGKFDAEIQVVLDNLAALFNTSGKVDTVTGESPASELLESRLFDEDIDDVLGNQVLNIKANPREVTSAEVREVADKIEILRSEGKENAKARILGRKIKNKNIASVAADKLRTEKVQGEIDTASFIQKLLAKAKKIKNIGRFTLAQWQNYLDIALNLKDVDNSEAINALDVEKILSDWQGFINKFGEAYRKSAKEAYGIDSDAKYINRQLDNEKVFNAGKELINRGLREETKGDKFTGNIGTDPRIENFSISQLQYFWLLMRDPSSHSTFFDPNGMNYTQEMFDELFQLLSPEDKQAATAKSEVIKSMLPEHDEVFKKLNGISVVQGVDTSIDYFPFSRELEGKEILGFEDDRKARVSISKSAQKGRVDSSLRFRKVSAEAILQKHIIEISHYIATADKLTDVRQIMTNTKLKKAIISVHGELLYEMMADNVTDMIRGRVQGGATIDRVINRLNSAFSRAVLRIKPVIAIKQLLSIPAYLEHMPLHAFVAGQIDFILKSANDIAHLRKNKQMQILRQVPRIFARDANPEVAIANMASDSESIIRLLKERKTINRMLDANVKMGDIGAIYAGGWALYRHLTTRKKNRLTHQQALDVVDRATQTRQQSRALNQTSAMQRSHALGRSFGMFRSAPFSYLRAEMEAIRQSPLPIVGRNKVSMYQAGRKFALYHFVLPLIWQALADVVTDEDGFDPDHLLRAAILGNLNVVPLIGNSLRFLYDTAVLADRGFEERPIPFLDGVNQFNRGIKDMVNGGLNMDAEEFWGGVEDLSSAAGKLVGKPVETFWHAYKGVKDAKENGLSRDSSVQILGQSPIN
jgi:hypothetical protein|tara:strand:- start:3967 stop:9708 length:5742 start_codon:yes stop_codon:yes gene_type:complete